MDRKIKRCPDNLPAHEVQQQLATAPYIVHRVVVIDGPRDIVHVRHDPQLLTSTQRAEVEADTVWYLVARYTEWSNGVSTSEYLTHAGEWVTRPELVELPDHVWFQLDTPVRTGEAS